MASARRVTICCWELRSGRVVSLGRVDQRYHTRRSFYRPIWHYSQFIITLFNITLPFFQSLAWSPYPSCDDLIAVGTDVGRVDLLRLSLSATVASANGHAVFPSPPVASFAARGAANASHRACNAIAFTELDSSLMVCAMERVRRHCLVTLSIC